MTAVRVGVVGPDDLVHDVADVVARTTDWTPIALAYTRESETAAVMASAGADVDAWLFTGVIPFETAKAADALDRPASYVAYTGATLTNAVVRMMRLGFDLSALSIDILDRRQIAETLNEIDLAHLAVTTLPFRLSHVADDLINFHRRAAADGSTAAVTCVRSVYDALRDELDIVRLAPSHHSVRTAINQLLIHYGRAQNDDIGLAIGLVRGDAVDLKAVESLAASLGGTTGRSDDGLAMVVTTRGPLEEFTSGFSELPALDRLGRGRAVEVGFGIGASGAEAEQLARRALDRADRLGAGSACVSMRNDIDLRLSGQQPTSRRSAVPLSIASSRAGVAIGTLTRLKNLSGGRTTVTTRVVADELGIQQRSARRVLNRLERAGLAEEVGREVPVGGGRPLIVYRLRI